MSTTQYQKAIGVFRDRAEAEAALRELQQSGFLMERVSVIAQNPEQTQGMPGANVHENVGNKADEGATTGAVTGGTLGGLTGLLVGLGTLAIPGVGPILLAGATATALATTVAGGAIGAAAGGLIGGLVGWGIPEERARVYNDRVRQGYYLVIIEGTPVELERAEAILRRHGIQDWDVYGQPQREVTPTNVAPPKLNTGIPTTRVNSTDTDYVTTTTRPTTNRTINTRKHAVAVFPDRQEAEQAVRDLRESGFPLEQVYVVATQTSSNHPFTGVRTHNRIDDYESLGILEPEANLYRDRLNRGQYLVMLNGTDEELQRAETRLNRRAIQQWDIYQVVADHPEVIIIDHRHPNV